MFELLAVVVLEFDEAVELTGIGFVGRNAWPNGLEVPPSAMEDAV